MTYYEFSKIIIVLVGAFISIFVYFNFSPIVRLVIIPKWLKKDEFLLVRIVIKNESRVRISKLKGKIQILEYKELTDRVLSEWVPFDKNSILSYEEPVKWYKPDEILNTTGRIYPGERITVERLYKISSESKIVHIGLNINIKLGLFGKITTCKVKSWSQTTTCFAVKQGE